MTAVSDLNELLSTMEPHLNEGVYVFATVKSLADVEAESIVAVMRETEGMSVVMSEADAGARVSRTSSVHRGSLSRSPRR